MADNRLELHEILKGILGSGNVYFQPPESLKLSYPCIVYELSNRQLTYADNKPYHASKKYQITVIDKRPNSEIPDRVSFLPMVSFSNRFVSDGLYHDVFAIYF